MYERGLLLIEFPKPFSIHTSVQRLYLLENTIRKSFFHILLDYCVIKNKTSQFQNHSNARTKIMFVHARTIINARKEKKKLEKCLLKSYSPAEIFTEDLDDEGSATRCLIASTRSISHIDPPSADHLDPG